VTAEVRSRVQGAAHLLDSGRAQDARRILATVLAEHPDEAVALRVMALVLLALDQPQEALDAARRAARLTPEDHVAQVVLAEAQRVVSGRGGAAESAAREAVRLAAADPRSWSALARAADAAGDRVDAGRRAVSLAPDDADSHNVLGIALLDTDVAAARASFERALALAPAHAPARSNLGLADLRDRRPVAAAEAFADTLRAAPGFELARRNLDVALTAMVRRSLLGIAVVLLGAAILLGDFTVPHDGSAVEPSGALGGVRVMWFGGLLVALGLVVRAVVRLSGPLRRYLLRWVRTWSGPSVWGLLGVAIVVLGSTSLFQAAGTGAQTRVGLLRLVALANLAAWISGRRRRAR
jgi:Flp pilus assembly protein TadD